MLSINEHVVPLDKQGKMYRTKLNDRFVHLKRMVHRTISHYSGEVNIPHSRMTKSDRETLVTYF